MVDQTGRFFAGHAPPAERRRTGGMAGARNPTPAIYILPLHLATPASGVGRRHPMQRKPSASERLLKDVEKTNRFWYRI